MAAIFKLKPLNLTFKYVGLIFAGGTLAVGGVGGRQRQEGPALHLAYGHVGVGKERVELLHEVLADEVRQIHLVEWVAQNRQKDLLKRQVSGNGCEI